MLLHPFTHAASRHYLRRQHGTHPQIHLRRFAHRLHAFANDDEMGIVPDMIGGGASDLGAFQPRGPSAMSRVSIDEHGIVGFQKSAHWFVQLLVIPLPLVTVFIVQMAVLDDVIASGLY